MNKKETLINGQGGGKFYGSHLEFKNDKEAIYIDQIKKLQLEIQDLDRTVEMVDYKKFCEDLKKYGLIEINDGTYRFADKVEELAYEKEAIAKENKKLIDIIYNITKGK